MPLRAHGYLVYLSVLSSISRPNLVSADSVVVVTAASCLDVHTQAPSPRKCLATLFLLEGHETFLNPFLPLPSFFDFSWAFGLPRHETTAQCRHPRPPGRTTILMCQFQNTTECECKTSPRALVGQTLILNSPVPLMLTQHTPGTVFRLTHRAPSLSCLKITGRETPPHPGGFPTRPVACHKDLFNSGLHVMSHVEGWAATSQRNLFG